MNVVVASSVLASRIRCPASCILRSVSYILCLLGHSFDWMILQSFHDTILSRTVSGLAGPPYQVNWFNLACSNFFHYYYLKLLRFDGPGLYMSCSPSRAFQIWSTSSGNAVLWSLSPSAISVSFSCLFVPDNWLLLILDDTVDLITILVIAFCLSYYFQSFMNEAWSSRQYLESAPAMSPFLIMSRLGSHHFAVSTFSSRLKPAVTMVDGLTALLRIWFGPPSSWPWKKRLAWSRRPL